MTKILVGGLVLLLCGCGSTPHTGVDFAWAEETIVIPGTVEWVDLVPPKIEVFDLEDCPFPLTPEEKWGKLLPPPRDAVVRNPLTAEAGPIKHRSE